jgi:hypothetical protein
MDGLTKMTIPVPPEFEGSTPPYVPVYGPMPNITPFTYRDGMTYLQRYEALVKYIQRVLIPWVQTNYDDLNDSFTEEMNKVIEYFNTVIGDLEGKSVEEALDEMTLYIDDILQQVIADGIQVQDPVVAGIVNEPLSLTSAALDATVGQPARRYSETFNPVITTRVTRTSNQTGIPDKNATPIIFTEELIESHSLHSTSVDQSRITVGPGMGGVWRAQGQVAFAGVAGASGDSNGHREVSIIRNGGTAYANVRANALPDATRSTIIQVDTGEFNMREGDYVELTAYHNRGSGSLALDISGTSTWLSLTRTGDRVGAGGTVYLASDWKYKGTKGYPGDQINADKIKFIDDPVYGPGRTVARFFVTNADNQVTYPRVQLGSSARFTVGDDLYIGYSVFTDPDIRDLDTTFSPVIGEVLGPPTGYGPNVFRIRHNNYCLEPERLYTGGDGSPYVPTGNYLSWSLPVAGRKGKWTYFVHRIKLSTDPLVGLHQLWVNLDDNTGWQQQSFVNPLTGAPVGTTLNLATLKAGINDGGNNSAFLKSAYTNYDMEHFEITYGPHRVATTLADACDIMWVP